jgi:hypothetical protein
VFGKLLAKIRRMVGERRSFDPRVLDDPVALQTDWFPAKGGGTNFRTHKLVRANPNRMAFRVVIGAMAFYSVFLAMGVGILVGFFSTTIPSGKAGLNAETVLSVVFGLVFACAGGAMWYFGTVPIVFDKQKGYFWKGRTAPDEVFDKSQLKHFATFEDIHALQLVSEYCRGDKSSYYSYELNLVLADGKRINVVDHGNREKLREDADALAEFLDRPVWDAI